jgi:type IV pilus assembly protein PilX
MIERARQSLVETAQRSDHELRSVGDHFRSEPGHTQRGMVLVTSLLLLVVVTLLAVSMFRSFGLDEKIAGNVRDKQRALNLAQTTEQFAENWLTQTVAYGNTGVTCNALQTVATAVVCNQSLALPVSDPTVVPWQIGGAPVGVTYQPAAPMAITPSTTGGVNSYYAYPTFYVSYAGPNPAGIGQIYKIDAAAYGGSGNTIAVIETTYLIQPAGSYLGGP